MTQNYVYLVYKDVGSQLYFNGRCPLSIPFVPTKFCIAKTYHNFRFHHGRSLLDNSCIWMGVVRCGRPRGKGRNSPIVGQT